MEATTDEIKVSVDSSPEKKESLGFWYAAQEALARGLQAGLLVQHAANVQKRSHPRQGLTSGPQSNPAEHAYKTTQRNKHRQKSTQKI